MDCFAFRVQGASFRLIAKVFTLVRVIMASPLTTGDCNGSCTHFEWFDKIVFRERYFVKVRTSSVFIVVKL